MNARMLTLPRSAALLVSAVIAAVIAAVPAPASASDDFDKLEWRPPSRLGLGLALGTTSGASVELVASERIAFDVAYGRVAFGNQYSGSATVIVTVKDARIVLLQVPIYLGAGV